jgi:hypothetical protein
MAGGGAAADGPARGVGKAGWAATRGEGMRAAQARWAAAQAPSHICARIKLRIYATESSRYHNTYLEIKIYKLIMNIFITTESRISSRNAEA